MDWLEDAVALLGRYGIRSILCTPTPTMPKWVYDKYPDTVAEDVHGHPIAFGNRQNNCFTSRIYRALSRNITAELTKRFKDNPDVVGWQLDNELGGPFCYCRQCENDFREWLAARYQCVGALNEAWGTNFWSHAYADFKELHLPRHPHPSPSMYLDFRRFHSDNVVRFAAEQAEIIRAVCPGHFITHNFMGMSSGINYFDLGGVLDFISEDYYYNFGESSWDHRFDCYLAGAEQLDFIRGIKKQP